ncbi:sensor histidine kinase, partial [Acinetobacter baumannii]
WQLHFSGGVTNPFTFLYLLQIVIGAILLPPDWSWIVAAIAVFCVGALNFGYVPLTLPPWAARAPLGLYLQGSFVCFLLIAALLVFF